MKKSIFIITLVFTLLLSCSGGGLVAYAASEDVYPFEQWCSENGYTFNCSDSTDSNYVPLNDLDFSTYEFIFLELTNSGGTWKTLYVFDKLVDNYIWLNSNGYYVLPTGTDSLCYMYSYNLSSEIFHFDNCISCNGNYKFDVKFTSVLYSTLDVYSDIDKTELFFQRTPLPPAPALPEIMQGVEMNPLKEIQKLLPMAILCLVGFVALRKALRILETILKRA